MATAPEEPKPTRRTALAQAFGPYVTLIRTNKPCRNLLVGLFLSNVGDWLNAVALFVLVYQLTGAAIAVAFVLAIRLAPQIVLSPLAGDLADRYDRRTTLILCDVLRAGLAVSFMFLNRIEWIYGVLIALYALSTIFRPTLGAFMRRIVRTPEEMAAAYSLRSLLGQAALFIGPALGGLLLTTVGTEGNFLLNGLSFLASAAALWTMGSLQGEALERRLTPRRPASFMEGMREGLRTMVADARLGVLICGEFIAGAIIGAAQAGVPVLVLVLGFEDVFLGYFNSASAIGTALCSAVVGVLVTRITRYATFASFVVGLPLPFILLGLSPGPWLWLVWFGLVGAVLALHDLVTTYRIQHGVEPQRIGRVFAGVQWIGVFGQLAGTLAVGLGLAAAPGRFLVGFGVVLLLLSLLLALVWGQRARRASSPAAAAAPPH